MNIIYLMGVLLVLGLCWKTCATAKPKSKTPHVPRLGHLIKAIQIVESGPRKEGDLVFLERGRAGEIGPYQIMPIMIKEINEVLSAEYTDDDWLCYDADKIIRRFFNVLCMCQMSKDATFPTEEQLARLWNGWDIHMEKESTKIYWDKVKLHLPEIVLDDLVHEIRLLLKYSEETVEKCTP